eukprot:GHVT01078604.1.p1 GENE.GHVT01078604.1~~GHVT01078604.1.p1  ORF type:complete len:791 (+),score=122.90 GHVT01078604.1:420-2792(+)
MMSPFFMSTSFRWRNKLTKLAKRGGFIAGCSLGSLVGMIIHFSERPALSGQKTDISEPVVAPEPLKAPEAPKEPKPVAPDPRKRLPGPAGRRKPLKAKRKNWHNLRVRIPESAPPDPLRKGSPALPQSSGFKFTFPNNAAPISEGDAKGAAVVSEGIAEEVVEELAEEVLGVAIAQLVDEITEKEAVPEATGGGNPKNEKLTNTSRPSQSKPAPRARRNRTGITRDPRPSVAAEPPTPPPVCAAPRPTTLAIPLESGPIGSAPAVTPSPTVTTPSAPETNRLDELPIGPSNSTENGAELSSTAPVVCPPDTDALLPSAFPMNACTHRPANDFGLMADPPPVTAITPPLISPESSESTSPPLFEIVGPPVEPILINEPFLKDLQPGPLSAVPVSPSSVSVTALSAPASPDSSPVGVDDVVNSAAPPLVPPQDNASQGSSVPAAFPDSQPVSEPLPPAPSQETTTLANGAPHKSLSFVVSSSESPPAEPKSKIIDCSVPPPRVSYTVPPLPNMADLTPVGALRLILNLINTIGNNGSPRFQKLLESSKLLPALNNLADDKADGTTGQDFADLLNKVNSSNQNTLTGHKGDSSDCQKPLKEVSEDDVLKLKKKIFPSSPQEKNQVELIQIPKNAGENELDGVRCRWTNNKWIKSSKKPKRTRRRRKKRNGPGTGAAVRTDKIYIDGRSSAGEASDINSEEDRCDVNNRKNTRERADTLDSALDTHLSGSSSAPSEDDTPTKSDERNSINSISNSQPVATANRAANYHCKRQRMGPSNRYHGRECCDSGHKYTR